MQPQEENKPTLTAFRQSLQIITDNSGNREDLPTFFKITFFNDNLPDDQVEFHERPASEDEKASLDLVKVYVDEIYKLIETKGFYM